MTIFRQNFQILFQALIEACQGTSLDEETNIRMISLFDNEEVTFVALDGQIQKEILLI